MRPYQIRFGRLIENVSDVVIPMRYAGDMSNVDISISQEASRRNGYQRALGTAFASQVYFHKRFQDVDGTAVYIVVDDDGVNRVES